MSAYTDEELLAVARVVWPDSPLPMDRARDAILKRYRDYHGCDEFCVRLALAHPEGADEALGPGWSVVMETLWLGSGTGIPTGPYLEWSWGGWRLRVDRRGRVFERESPSANCEIPPEFDGALARARLIAAAWARIEASK